jgi:hypothetical protein
MNTKQLKELGFEHHDEYFIHPQLGIGIDKSGKICTDDLSPEEEEKFVKEYGDNAIAILVDYITALRTEDKNEPGFLNEVEDRDLDLDYLRSLVDVFDTNRELTIYTWGRRLKKSKPYQSQRNFNACVLNGRAKGIDLRKNNGLCHDIQRVVSRCTAFKTWINMCIKKIETDNLRVVSINCSKGRHRSVAAAEILKKAYYPEAKIIHLTIY